jgi:tetratricopeptide (TPR) repeat protein
MRVAKNVRMMVLALLPGAAVAFAQSQQQTTPPASPPSSQSSPQSNRNAPPQTPASPAKKPNATDENPFPEDISRKAAQGDEAPPAAAPTSPPRSSPGGSAPPEPADSSSRSKFAGLGEITDNGDRISNGAGGYIVNPKLAAEDVKVGGFYLDRHDYKGAYARYKEATLIDPGNADAVFGLAEAARGLNHKGEAVQNYRIYLDAVPDSKRAKDARKALTALGELPGSGK